MTSGSLRHRRLRLPFHIVGAPVDAPQVFRFRNQDWVLVEISALPGMNFLWYMYF